MSSSDPSADSSALGFSDAYRSAAAAIAAPVAVLTCERPAGLTGITVSSFLDVSYDPPTMAVSIYSGSRMMEALDAAQMFTLSVLAADQKGIAQWLGEPGQPSYGLFSSIATVPGLSGPAHIAGCAAYFEVAIEQRFDVATHTLLAGPVRACAADPAARPLLRWGDGYETVG